MWAKEVATLETLCTIVRYPKNPPHRLTYLLIHCIIRYLKINLVSSTHCSIANITIPPMKYFNTNNEDIGKQKGQLSPVSYFLTRTSILLALVAIFYPVTTFAAGFIYLKENAPTYIENIKSDYGDMVNIASMLHDYDKNIILAVIVVESEGRTEAMSHRGAQGLMQLMPPTAKAMGVKDPNDPFQNILAGTKYLKQLEDNYGFDSPQEALVAYNMGPSRAHRWLSQYAPEDYGYVAKVMYVYGIIADQEKAKQQVASAISNKMNEEAKLSATPKPLLTKPRSLSLAAFPMTLPSSRKEEIEK